MLFSVDAYAHANTIEFFRLSHRCDLMLAAAIPSLVRSL